MDRPLHVEAIDEVPAEEVAPGITRRALHSSSRLTAWVIDFAPGSQWPEVDHHGEEERYFVISGEMIENGQLVGPGSYVTFAAGSSHQPTSRTGARILGHNVVA